MRGFFLGLLVVLSMNSIAFAHQTQMVQQNADLIVNVESFDQVTVPSWDQPETFYYDLLSRCTFAVGDLSNAQNEANLVYNSNLKEANQILISALEKSAADLETGVVTAAPHTATAIIEASKVAKAYWSLLPTKTEIGSDPHQQGYFGFINRLYILVYYAYNELDVNQFENVVTHCIRGKYCYSASSNVHSFFSDKYFDGVRRLGMQFLDVLVDSADQAGWDHKEMKMTSSISAATATVLNRSTYRRDFACDIVDLINIGSTAEKSADGLDRLPSHIRMNDLRRKMAIVYRSVQNKAAGSGCYRRRW